MGVSNIFHAQTTKNTKNKTTKKKKQTTTKQSLLLFYRIRVHYTVLTQHTTPTNNTHQGILLYQRGDSIEQQSCCSRHPTACQKTKQTKTQTHLLPCKTLMANWPKKPYFVSLIPLHAHTTHAHTRGVSHLKTKTATTRCSPAPRNNGKTRHPARRLTRHPTQWQNK